MRHQVAGYRLGRTKDQRIGLRRTLIRQLFTHEKIKTTRAKAMAIRGEAEKLITLARNSGKGTPESKSECPPPGCCQAEQCRKWSRNCLMILARALQPARVATRGCFSLGPRLGDAAEMVLLELG